jgi:inositol transport system ATP-binding protein
MVEIAKAVSWNADIVIMDEPTSALTESEVAHLFTIIRDLRQQGKAIIYISHKMDEIFAITDEISVFRDGTWVGSKHTTEFTRQSLITQMVGRELTQLFPKFNNAIGEEVLTVRNLSRKGSFTISTLAYAAAKSSAWRGWWGRAQRSDGEPVRHG